MKSFIWLGLCLLVSAAAYAQVDTMLVIQSDAVLECEGETILSPFRVVLSEDRLTVNDCEINSVDHMDLMKKDLGPMPSIESTDYIFWLVLTVTKEATLRLKAGQDKKTVWQFMKDFLEEHTRDSENASLILEGPVFDGMSGLKLKHSSWEYLYVGVVVPTVYPEDFILSRRRELLYHSFQKICDYLRSGGLVIAESGYVSRPAAAEEE